MSCVVCRESELDLTYCGHCGERLADRDPQLGRMLAGRYRLVERIAAGGFGTVYRAVTRGGAEVAIKLLHESEPDTRARFRREAVAMASLRDPHTVTTYELGEDRGDCFIAMELLRGETLARRLSRCGPLTWRTALAIVRDIASALAEAHARGVVHRDLKPANIFLVGEHDFVKVLDFGIAKIARGSDLDDGAQLTRAGQLIGTPLYMSPEQRIGGAIDHRTDLFALGVIGYELITGLRPFAAEGAMTPHPPPPSALAGCPPEVDALVLCCVAANPSDRFANVVALTLAIDRALEIEERSEAPTVVDRRPPRGSRPRRDPSVTINVTGVAMLVVALYSLGIGLGMAIGLAT